MNQQFLEAVSIFGIHVSCRDGNILGDGKSVLLPVYGRKTRATDFPTNTQRTRSYGQHYGALLQRRGQSR